MAGRSKLSPSQQAVRRKLVQDKYLRGVSQMQIASDLKVSQTTVSRELAWWHEEWKKRTCLDIDKRRLEELQRIDRLELTAWEGWERSRLDAETFHVEKTTGRTHQVKKKSEKKNLDGSVEKAEWYETVKLPDLEKSSKTVKGQAGDPRFLERVGWCVHERCQILHILKEVTGGSTVGQQIIFYIPENGRDTQPSEESLIK